MTLREGLCAAAGFAIAFVLVEGIYTLAEFIAHRWNPFL